MKKIFNIKLIIFILIILLSILTYFIFPKNINIKNNKSSLQNNFQEQIIKQEDVVEEKEKNINMIFFGDIMLGRNIEFLSQDNINYPLKNIDKKIFENNDIVYANLEGPIMDPHFKTKNGSTVFSFRKEAIDILKNYNFNLVSLANNHMQDHGDDGYKQTQDFLKSANISFVGDYYNKENIYIKKNIDGKDFVFFGFNMINKSFEKNIDDNKKNILENIKKIKEENPNSFFIVFPHWGNEYKIHSNKIQQDFSHEIIDSGVDLIIASHPHVTQEYEVYNNKYIFYSLGNFIFDQYFSKETQEMISVKLNMKCKDNNECENKIEIIPIKSINSQPEIITDEKEKDNFIKKYFK